MINGGDGVFALLALLPIIFYLVLTGFAIYFLIKVIKFMNKKTKLDQEKNGKLDELIKALNQDKEDWIILYFLEVKGSFRYYEWIWIFTNDTGYRGPAMEGLEIYDFLRLVFITFIISSIVISIILFVQRKRSTIVNGFTVSITSIVSIIVSGINLIIMGYIADELNLAGDVISSYMFLIIIGLSILNWFIYSKNKKSII